MARGKRSVDTMVGTVAFQPSLDAFEITKSDMTIFPASRIYVGAPGNVSVTTAGGAKVTFHNFPAGHVLPVKCIQVLAKGTTADFGFVGIGE